MGASAIMGVNQGTLARLRTRSVNQSGELPSSASSCDTCLLLSMASSSGGDAHYDYTEGATAIDIQQAINGNSRGRRDSRYGADGEGTMFDGPGHYVNPSSVSRMSLDHRRRSSDAWSRASRSRRQSEDRGDGHSLHSSRSKTLYGSVDLGNEYSSPGEESGDPESHGMSRRRRVRSRPSTPPPHKHGVLENIANMFARNAPTTESPPHSRRASIASRTSRTRLLRRHSSRRSEASSDYAVESEEEEEGDSRWGYSSGEEDESEAEENLEELRAMASDSELDFGSYPPSPSGGTNLPLLAGDAIFGGEIRLEIGDFDVLDPPPPGPPSRQIIHLTEEDTDVRLVGFETIAWRRWAWRTCCVLTCGVLALLGHWFPRLWLRWVAREKAFKDAHDGFVVVEVRADVRLCMCTVPTDRRLYIEILL